MLNAIKLHSCTLVTNLIEIILFHLLHFFQDGTCIIKPKSYVFNVKKIVPNFVNVVLSTKVVKINDMKHLSREASAFIYFV